MKQVKVNLMVIAAITIAVMTMSFKVSNSNQEFWYHVNEESNGRQALDPIALPGAPSDPDCNELFSDNVCAVKLEIMPPEYYDEIELADIKGIAGRED